MSGSPSATRNSVASSPLIPEFRCFESGGCAVGPTVRTSTELTWVS
jgi:hypothetical protein